MEVDVKPDWASKINWTQLVSSLAVITAMFGFDVSPETQAHIVAGIAVVSNVVTFIMRTWFTTKLTTSNAAKI